jgi:hypothetical protein
MATKTAFHCSEVELSPTYLLPRGASGRHWECLSLYQPPLTNNSPLLPVSVLATLVMNLDVYLTPLTLPLGEVHQIVDPILDIVCQRILWASDENATTRAMHNINIDFLAAYNVFPGIALPTPNSFLLGKPWDCPFLDWTDMLRTVYTIEQRTVRIQPAPPCHHKPW